MYKTNTKAKRLSETAFAVTKLEERNLIVITIGESAKLYGNYFAFWVHQFYFHQRNFNGKGSEEQRGSSCGRERSYHKLLVKDILH